MDSEYAKYEADVASTLQLSIPLNGFNIVRVYAGYNLGVPFQFH